MVGGQSFLPAGLQIAARDMRCRSEPRPHEIDGLALILLANAGDPRRQAQEGRVSCVCGHMRVRETRRFYTAGGRREKPNQREQHLSRRRRGLSPPVHPVRHRAGDADSTSCSMGKLGPHGKREPKAPKVKSKLQASKPSSSSSNDAALKLKLNELTGGVDPEADDDAWLEALVVTSEKPIECDDPDDDLKRELSFYNQALSAVRIAQERFERLNIPHVRPDDYFAEMLKSDNHMAKVKRRMITEQADLRAAEERRKQQANKKFGKQVQKQVLHERVQKRVRETKEITEMRKKRKGGSADGLDIDVDDFGGAPAHKRDRAAAFSRGGKGGGGKGGGKGGISKKEWKDKKFGHTRGTGSKRNDAACARSAQALM